MKAEISRDGTLTILPETEVEDYALAKWHIDFAVSSAALYTHTAAGKNGISIPPQPPYGTMIAEGEIQVAVDGDMHSVSWGIVIQMEDHDGVRQAMDMGGCRWNMAVGPNDG